MHRFLIILSSFLLQLGLQAQPVSDTSEARAILSEAQELLDQRSYEAAANLSLDARDLFESLEGTQSLGVADALELLGETLIPQRELDLAIQSFNQALDIRAALLPELDPAIDICYSRLGGCYQDMGDFDQAILFYKKSLDLRLQYHGEINSKVVSSHRVLGSCYLSKGDYQRAFDLYENGYTIQCQLETDPKDFKIRLLNNLGVVRQSQGDIDQALLYYQKMLEATSQHPKQESIGWLKATAYLNIGDAYLLKEDPAKALEYLKPALAIFGPNSPSSGFVYGSSAKAYGLLGNYELAAENLALWKRNWDENMPAGHPFFSKYYHQAGEFHVLNGDIEKGLELLELGKDINLDHYGGQNPEVSNSYIALGKAYLKKGDFPNARTNFNYALIANGGENMETNCLNPDFVVEGYRGIGEVYLARYELEKRDIHLKLALNNFENALELIRCNQASFYSVTSKARLSEKAYPIIEKSLNVLLQLYDQEQDTELLTQIFDLLEQSKSVQLFESLQETEALQFAGIPSNLLERENDLRIDLTFLDKKKRELLEEGLTETDSSILRISSRQLDLQNENENLRKQFERDYPSYYALKYDLASISLQDLRNNLLTRDQTLLEYFVGNETIVLFAIKKDAVKVLNLPLDFPLQELVTQMRMGIFSYYAANEKTDQLLESSVRDYVSASQTLYQHLIQPIADFIEGNIIIVPDGPLGYLPFDALLTGAPKDIINFSTYPYLFRKHALSYNYSATLLNEMMEKEHFINPENTWLGFAPFFEGDYNYIESRIQNALAENGSSDIKKEVSLRGRNFTSLPNSGEEMALGGFLWDGQYYLGDDATRETFEQLAQQARIIHLSTHGVADARVGDYSFLAFAELENNPHSGLLYVRDLYNLQLNADLVVLSACETGVGEFRRGEGMISLARAFAYAGSKSILTSLWVVDDIATMDLIKTFYLEIKKGTPKETALQQAKSAYLENHPGMASHPFFWAGFIPIGDMSKLTP